MTVFQETECGAYIEVDRAFVEMEKNYGIDLCKLFRSMNILEPGKFIVTVETPKKQRLLDGTIKYSFGCINFIQVKEEQPVK